MNKAKPAAGKASSEGTVNKKIRRGRDLLTIKEIEARVKTPGDFRLGDGAGLYLRRQGDRSPSWSYLYSLSVSLVDGTENGTKRSEKMMGLGSYPVVSLKQAREARDAAALMVKSGKNPVAERRLERVAGHTAALQLFSDLADAWLRRQEAGWSDIHAKISRRALELHALPLLGNLPVAAIMPVHLNRVVEELLDDGKRDTAGKLVQHLRAIFAYGARLGLRNDNPADVFANRGALGPAKEVRHQPALLTFPELGALLRAAEVSNASTAIKLCNRLIAYTAVRIDNGVSAQWQHFDLYGEVPSWSIPRAAMKVSKGRTHDHKVILPSHLVDALRRWHSAMGKPEEGYLFPGQQGRRFVSREAIEKFLRETLGYRDRHSPHGWRSAFATLTKDHVVDAEVGGGAKFSKAAVDLALDHVHDGEVARAYDRGLRLIERQRIADWWGAQLAAAEAGDNVVALKASA